MINSQNQIMVDETSRLSSLDLYEDLLYHDSKQGNSLTIQEVSGSAIHLSYIGC